MINRAPSKMLGLWRGRQTAISESGSDLCFDPVRRLLYGKSGAFLEETAKGRVDFPEEWNSEQNIYRENGGNSRSSESRVPVSGKALQSLRQEAGNWGVGR